ncbi:unnamed protein product [Meloidogyne enterolobii]|uniref:Uncharacterized protein n=1 Tax=Meloidogyne enterolobii TaxID=390850 RepID=A0ACB1AXG1_MELEN
MLFLLRLYFFTIFILVILPLFNHLVIAQAPKRAAPHTDRLAPPPIVQKFSNPSLVSRADRTPMIHPPSIRPPKGVALMLNRAKLKDFMRIGREIIRQRQLLQAKAKHRQ